VGEVKENKDARDLSILGRVTGLSLGPKASASEKSGQRDKRPMDLGVLLKTKKNREDDKVRATNERAC